MYCMSCGSFVPDNQGICPNCGAPVQNAANVQQPVQPVYQPVAQPVYQQPAYQQPPVYQQPVANPIRGNGLGTAGMVMGIVSICISWIPVINVIVFFSGILGFIFSLIGVCRRNVTGKGRAIAGLVLSIVAVIITYVMYYALSTY